MLLRKWYKLYWNEIDFYQMHIIMILCCVLSRFYRRWVLLRNWVFLVSFWLAVLLVSQYCPGANILWLCGGSDAYSVMCVCAWRGGGVEVRGLGQCNGGKKCGWGMWWEGKVWYVCEGMWQQSCWVKWNVQWFQFHTRTSSLFHWSGMRGLCCWVQTISLISSMLGGSLSVTSEYGSLASSTMPVCVCVCACKCMPQQWLCLPPTLPYPHTPHINFSL